VALNVLSMLSSGAPSTGPAVIAMIRAAGYRFVTVANGAS
jgi:hypothetical protein